MLRDGTYGFSSLSEKTRTSNHLQISLQRQHLSSVSLGPFVLVRPGFEPTTSRSADCRRSPNWANQAAVIILIHYALPDAILTCERSREWNVIDCLGSYRKRVLKKRALDCHLKCRRTWSWASIGRAQVYAGVNMLGESLHSHYLPASAL